MCVMAVWDNPEAIFQGLLASGAAADNLAFEYHTPDLSTGRTSKDPDVQLLAKMAPLLQKLLDVNPSGRFDGFQMHVAMGLYAPADLQALQVCLDRIPERPAY